MLVHCRCQQVHSGRTGAISWRVVPIGNNVTNLQLRTADVHSLVVGSIALDTTQNKALGTRGRGMLPLNPITSPRSSQRKVCAAICVTAFNTLAGLGRLCGVGIIEEHRHWLPVDSTFRVEAVNVFTSIYRRIECDFPQILVTGARFCRCAKYCVTTIRLADHVRPSGHSAGVLN
ncbi:Uncharacterised protein [Klebsiella pneumoniae]|nr:hypothetical protein AI2608V2_5202 [Klebsiella pneumoniae]CAH4155158.1 hypothetical protein AI2608V2_5202 [Klebsiella pneumoniae]SVQ88761.1 Uncharacterised protein [Klebsiella pneumoniae]SVX49068.1 Uncharacterised protein [Klebsiella pneumoniae]SWR16418.1 Uncharacterised protein [Klebsiella pneumoniae]